MNNELLTQFERVTEYILAAAIFLLIIAALT